MSCRMREIQGVPEGKWKDKEEQKEWCNQPFNHVQSKVLQLSVDNPNIMCYNLL